MRISDWSSDVCSSDLRGLGIAEAVLLAELQRLVPGRLGRLDQRLVGAVARLQLHRRDGDLPVACALAVRAPDVLAGVPPHAVDGRRVARAGAQRRSTGIGERGESGTP